MRKSNIELLRIFCILGIIVLHFNHPDLGGGFSTVPIFSVNSFILVFLESLFIVGVDVFMIISGYFMCDKDRVTLDKPLMLLIQVIVYRFGISLISLLFLGGDMKSFLVSLLPVNYFAVLYISVYLLAPFINRIFKEISDESFKTLIMVGIILFSVATTVTCVLQQVLKLDLGGLSPVGVLGNQGGYTIVNFLMMYVIGAYIRRLSDKGKKFIKHPVIVGIITLVLIFIWGYISFAKGVSNIAFNYDNPLVILLAICIFTVFVGIDIGSSRLINSLAKGCFGVFLLHMPFMVYIKAEYFVDKNPLVLLAAILVLIVGIFLICWVVDYIYHLIYKYTLGKLFGSVKIIK